MKTILEIVQDCNNFSEEKDRCSEQKLLRWRFFLPNDQRCQGWITHSVIRRLPWTCDFRRNFLRKTITLAPISSEPFEESCDKAIDKLLDRAREQGRFPNLQEKRNKKYSILGANFPIGIERSASSLFGIVGQGVHMTVYTRTEGGEMKIWISQRNLNKHSHPGLLDNTVAGGVALGEEPFESLCREAEEEAGLTREVMESANSADTITWFNVSDSRSGGEDDLMKPGISHVYDLQVGNDMVLKPVDRDIHAFELMSVEDVTTAIKTERFKPLSASVMVNFFIRHGFITA